METYNYDDPAASNLISDGSAATASMPLNSGMDNSASPQRFTQTAPAVPTMNMNGGNMNNAAASQMPAPAASQMPAPAASQMPAPAAPQMTAPAASQMLTPAASQRSAPATQASPTMPANSNNSISQRFAPIGAITPSTPSLNLPNPNTCVNCSGNGNRPVGGNTNILWTWGVLSPFFSTTTAIAHVRFYNAAAIREPLDIYLNGRLVVSNLDYMNYTNFLHIVPGVYRLTVYRRSFPGSAIIDTGVQFRGGISYTLTILGTAGNYSVQLMTS